MSEQAAVELGVVGLPGHSTILMVTPAGSVEVLADPGGLGGRFLTPRAASRLIERRAGVAMHAGVRFVHARLVRPGDDAVAEAGRATVAFELIDDGSAVRFAVAWCSPRDRFSRPRGREVAACKLRSKLASLIIEAPKLGRGFIARLLAEVSRRDSEWPRWALIAAHPDSGGKLVV